MKKESIKLIIYQEDGKTKVKFKEKHNKKSSQEIKNLHLMLKLRIVDILRKLRNGE